MSIYQDIILEHYRSPRNFGRIKDPTATAHLNNPLCGDVIDLDISVKNDKVMDIKFSGEGCAISKSAASMLTERVKGKPVSKLINLDKAFMINLIGIDIGINRLKCLLLPLEALHKALKNG